jgi:hypothetical protein
VSLKFFIFCNELKQTDCCQMACKQSVNFQLHKAGVSTDQIDHSD